MEQSQKIGPYLIEKELAQSSTCSVFRAYDDTLNRPVLIKKLHPQMAREDDVRDRFEREAKVCAHLSQENIVSIYGFHADPELTMLVLEYVEGMNLGELIKQNTKLPWRVVLVMLSNVLSGLAHAHSRGVIHRDIKPDNILISDQGAVKITDFGLATIEDAPKLTRQGMVLGTPAYLPPEGLIGTPIDTRGDLFSLGATFYEALTGDLPFQGENFSETMNKILKLEPPSPSTFDSDIPLEFDNIIMRMLEKKPTQRYGSAEQALHEVNRLAAAKGISLNAEGIRQIISRRPFAPEPETTTTKTSSEIRRVASSIYPLGRSQILNSAPEETAEPAPVPTDVKPARKGKTILIGVGYLALLVIVVSIVVWLSKNPGTPEIIDEPNQSIAELNQAVLDSTAQTTPDSLESDSANAELTKPETTRPVVSSRQEVAVGDDGKNLVDQETPSEEETASRRGSTQASESTIAKAPVRVDVIQRPGTLSLSTKQWANVSVDNQLLGQTPPKKTLELEAGAHSLVLENDEFPSPIVLPIEIQPDSTLRMEIDLTDHFGELKITRVNPWAEVYIDGRYVCQTPRTRPIYLPFGHHVIELRHPNFPIWQNGYDFSPDSSSVILKVDLNAVQADIPEELGTTP